MNATFSRIPYDKFFALRAKDDVEFTAEEQGRALLLKCRPNGLMVETMVNPDTDDMADYLATKQMFANAPIDAQEVRFKTHDFADKSDWDGRTHGDQVAYLAGGAMKHPVDGSWLDATGAAMVAAYGGVPNADHTGDPTYLFGALLHRITAVYDDVQYRWMSADGATRYAWLDTSVKPCVWKDDTGAVVVHYDTIVADWVRNADNAVVTSSLWRILPYAGYKIQINLIKSQFDATTTFTGSLHYQIYMDLLDGVAGAGYPAGNYKVADWEYKSLADIASGADRDPYVEPITRPGHSGPIMTLTYDYRAATVAPIIDSANHMHLDIILDSNQPVTDTPTASATFICMKIRSF